MAKRSVEPQNRVWFEIERHNDDQINVTRAALLSTVLERLGCLPGTVWWNERKQLYCATIDSGGSFLELTDNGHWFNLDRMAKIATDTVAVA